MKTGMQWMMAGFTAVLMFSEGCAKLQPNAENIGQPAGTATTPTASSAKSITYFAFPSVPVVATISGSSISAQVPTGTNLTNLRAVVLIDAASVSVAGISQTSGVSVNDFSGPVVYTVTAQDGSTASYTVTVTVNATLKEMLYFNLPNVGGIATISGPNISVVVPYGTNVTNLVAVFLTNGASVRIGATMQSSGITVNDFTTAKIYTVTASDASTQNYTVTVTASNPTKEILSYGFGSYVGRISGTNITVDVPYGTNVISVTPTFQSNGIYVKIGTVTQTSGSTTVDLSTPKIYTVTAQDGTTKDYTVTANIGLNTSKDITSFSIPSLNAIGIISGNSITVNVPYGSNVTNLVAAFATTGASVKVGATTQTSGTTANNFTAPLIYTITAADASTQNYTVTVHVAAAGENSVAQFIFSAAGVTGTLSGNTIAATVPYGTNIQNLVATFSTTGFIVKVNGVTQTSGVTPNNFTSAVVYTVTAQDGTIASYTVQVNVSPPNSNANISFFTMTTTADFGIFSGTNIAVRVPTGTNLTNLVPVFKITGSVVKVNGVTQFSGVTANDFTNPVSYVVTAQDGTSKTYTVTVTIVAYDVFPPALTSVTATPTSTSTYPATVTIRVYYTETGSGYSFSGFSLCSPTRISTGTGGSTITASSVTNAGAYLQGTVTLQNYHESGTWKVCSISMSDNAGNNSFYMISNYLSTTNYAVSTSSGYIDSGIPIGGAVNVTGTTQDITAPALTSVTATPTSTSTYPATVTIRVYYTETGSGYSFSGFSLCSPTRISTGTGGSTITASSVTNAGAYLQGTVTLQNYHESGTWKVCSISMSDNAGNNSFYMISNYLSTTNYAVSTSSGYIDSGIPIGGAVNVTGTTQDITAPALTSVTATPTSTSTYPATVTIRVYYTETGSGYSFSGFSLCSPTRISTGTGGSTITASSVTNAGAYLQGTVTLQNYHESGTWKVCSISMSDNAGNNSFYMISNYLSTTNYAVSTSSGYIDSGIPIGGAVDKQ